MRPTSALDAWPSRTIHAGAGWIVVLCAALGACRDAGLLGAGVTEPIQLAAASVRAVESRGPTWAVDRSDPYVCFTSVLAPGGPIKYLYRRQRQQFPARVLASTREVEALSYRVVEPDGTPRWVLNCTIPSSVEARAIVAKRFRLWEGGAEPGTITTQGCVAGGVCELPGLTATACGPGWMGEYPNCYKVFQPQCGALDPTCGGFGGSGDPGEGSSGGGEPCTDCGPGTPILTCYSAVRGEVSSCDISTNGGGLVPITVSWTFTGGGETRAGPAGALSWGGIFVQSGQVSVTLSTGNTLQAALTVTNRSWRWTRGTQMLLSHGTAPLPVDGRGYEEWAVGDSTRLGWNCTRGGCGTLERVLPDIGREPRGGYEVASVPSGPNQGFWYVTAVTFKMDRETAVNRSLLPDAARHTLSSATQAAQCRTAMGLASGTPVSVNMYEFNKRCMGSPIDAMIAGAFAHEELGTTGRNGHEGRAYYFAEQTTYDPYFQVGDLVAADETALRGYVFNLVRPLQLNLETLSGDHNFVTGNWSGTLWLWNSTRTAFVEALIPAGI